MNGRAPGFASFVLYLPKERLTVIAMSNIYSSATTDIGYDIAADRVRLAPMTFSDPPKPFLLPKLRHIAARFSLGPTFTKKMRR
jgi:hypothetical protein